SAVMVSTSVALTSELPAKGGGVLALTVLTSVPVASGFTVPVRLNAALAPFGKLTVVLMLPVPDGGVQVAQSQVTFVSESGTTSVIATSGTASSGPLFVTVIW